MFKALKIIAMLSMFVAVAVVVMIAVQLDKKADRVPTMASASLHQKHQIGEQVKLFIIGDMGSPTEQQKQISDAMEKHCLTSKPDAIVFLGDNFYHGGVSSVDDPKWHTNLLNYYRGPCLKETKIYAILGNHDYEGNAQAQVDFTNTSERWTMPYRYYDVSFGDLLSMTAVDPWYPDYCFFVENCMTNFMLDSLKNNAQKTWSITIGHYPLKSISSNTHGDHTGSWVGTVLEKLLCNGGNDAYLSGHAHHLEHRASSTCDMDLIVSGAGGGGKQYGIDQARVKETSFASNSLGFTELIANKEALSVNFIDASGEVVYQFSRDKNNLLIAQSK